MVIGIKLCDTEQELFCSSKWWGDPDLPADMEYPTLDEYPLTFVCQIDCEDIARFDPEGLLPHQGMFYVFAAMDQYVGYDAPYENGPGEWPKKHVVVKFTKAINFETFQSAIQVDENDEPLTEPALRMTFGDGNTPSRLLPFATEDEVCLMEIASGTAGIEFPGGMSLQIYYSRADFDAGKWKLVKARLV